MHFYWFYELGLQENDHDGSKAHMLEGAVGIKVIRHSECCCSLSVLNLYYNMSFFY